MAKVAFIKDPHLILGLAKPISRTDSFFSDMWAKYESLAEKLKAREITHIVFTGDIFQVKAPSKYNINAISLYDKLFLELWGDFEKYTIRGNHDMFKTKEGNPANSIFEIGVTHNWYSTLENTPLVLDDIVIMGLDYRDSVGELEEELLKLSDRAIEYSFLGKKTAIVVHEHLVPNTREMFLNTYILYDWFTNLNFDYVVGGHLHKGFKTQTIEDVTFINSWSMTRLVRDHYSIDDKHKPCFVYLHLEDGAEKELKTIALKHRPYDQSFTETIVSESGLIGNLAAFKAKLSKAGSVSEVDLELLKELAPDLDYDSPEQLEQAIRYIEELLKGDEYESAN